jgi:Outer membrane protein beta-barrel domain
MSSHRIAFTLLAGLIAGSMAPSAFGQRFEFGGGGGVSFYNKRTATAASSSVEAGFKPGYTFNGFLGQMGNRLGGELRYSFASNEMELTSGGKSFAMTGRSQAIHYDLLFYFNEKSAKVRPYLLAGGGMKQYAGTGTGVVLQPFMATVVLTNTSEWKPMITGGGGIRVALNPKLHLRAEVLAQMTQVPTKVITPVLGDIGGWYFDIMPTINLSYVW